MYFPPQVSLICMDEGTYIENLKSSEAKMEETILPKWANL
jgi:hypothetical protein